MRIFSGSFFLFASAFLYADSPGSARDADAALDAFFSPQTPAISAFNSQLKQITLGPKVVFATADGRYVFTGDVVDTKTGKRVSEEAQAHARVAYLAQQPKDIGIHYAAEKPQAATLTVFTDIACPFCRRLHQEIPKLAGAGLNVRYLMLPRGGKGSEVYHQTAKALCGKQPGAAMTRLMQGETLSEMSCAHDLDAQFNLAAAFEIQSTPTLMLPDGRLVLGYRSADQILAMIDSTRVEEVAP